MQWSPVYFLDGVDETDNVISHRIPPEDIKLDASSLRFLNENNVNLAKDPGMENAQKIDSMGVNQFKSNKKEAFLERHRPHA